MRPVSLVGVLAAVLLGLPMLGIGAVAQQPSPPPAVKVGQAAPDFTLPYLARGADDKVQEKTLSLADFKGKKTVILGFFPAAFSPG